MKIFLVNSDQIFYAVHFCTYFSSKKERNFKTALFSYPEILSHKTANEEKSELMSLLFSVIDLSDVFRSESGRICLIT